VRYLLKTGELAYIEPGDYKYICEDHYRSLPSTVFCPYCQEAVTYDLQYPLLGCQRGHTLLIFTEPQESTADRHTLSLEECNWINDHYGAGWLSEGSPQNLQWVTDGRPRSKSLVGADPK
jgi:hypothetical protein